jgi:RNA polymerase sigma-70 factor (ECF subfamily)
MFDVTIPIFTTRVIRTAVGVEDVSMSGVPGEGSAVAVPSRTVSCDDPRGWDRRLAGRLAAGDDGALATVYDQYAPLVFGVAVHLVGDQATAADVCQEVFLSLWQHPDRYDPDLGSLRTWLATVARRRAIDVLRQRGRRATREERAAADPVTPPDIEEAATALVEAERVRRALVELPPDQRAAIELAYYEGLTHREMAARLGIPEGTVKSRLRLGVARLGRLLGTEEGVVRWT